MPSFCSVESRDHVLFVTIRRPEVMNAIHAEANAELVEAFDAFEADPDLWVAVLTGAGERAFCAGLDLKYLAGTGVPFESGPSGFCGVTQRPGCTKPIVAAVNGVAMGGGFEAALACDLIIAADSARFALPEPRVGVAALAGGMHRLPRQIGLKPAMGLLLTGRTVSAEEGLRLGFVNEVVPQADLMPAVARWVDQILTCAPLSVRASKQCALEGLRYGTVGEAMAARYEALDAMIASEDFREGPRAFAEKRRPEWRGR